MSLSNFKNYRAIKKWNNNKEIWHLRQFRQTADENSSFYEHIFLVG